MKPQYLVFQTHPLHARPYTEAPGAQREALSPSLPVSPCDFRSENSSRQGLDWLICFELGQQRYSNPLARNERR